MCDEAFCQNSLTTCNLLKSFIIVVTIVIICLSFFMFPIVCCYLMPVNLDSVMQALSAHCLFSNVFLVLADGASVELSIHATLWKCGKYWS